ncbi:unnamed protein product [Ilex paraguariensis]|uniref:Germin-like protein n=1 Tax=Ilex paraguariensis TaxID=185542 RepID=A0ABC8USE4_9AQUA
MGSKIIFLGLIAVSCYVASAADPSPLQDFCVADQNSTDPKVVEANDFFFTGLHLRGNTSNRFGLRPTPVTVAQVPGLNTLGISIFRVDFAPFGVTPPHTHPRASEVVLVLKGQLEVGFVASNPENRPITKVIGMGDMLAIPFGLTHFQRNIRNGTAVILAVFNSQTPGIILMANSVFGSKPDISNDVLQKAFQVDQNVISQLQNQF